MCGIVGVWNMEAEDISDLGLDVFIDSVAHRGPDGRGAYRDRKARISLGHRRLAILDLSETGRQPMCYADGRYAITYNGEVYNYLELKAELKQFGHRFIGSSDTEVILAAYAQWGEQCQLRFNGMWAFGIWDRRERTLFLSRDRFGVKPLYYYNDGNRFVFASEMKAFLALSWFRPVYNSSITARALTSPREIEGSEECLFSGLKRLMGGHSITLKEKYPPKVKRWWNTLDHLERVPRGIKKQSERFRELFFDACNIRMRSDVPVGAALSGGMDSGSVFCAITETRKAFSTTEKNDFKAFVAAHPGTTLDERRYAEDVLRHTGKGAIFKTMGPYEGIHEFDNIVFDLEEIYDQFSTPWQLYRQMRENGFVVSIDGHGGDELLAGYHHYPKEAMSQAIWPLPNYTKFQRMKAILKGMYPPETQVEFPDFSSELASAIGDKANESLSKIAGKQLLITRTEDIRRVVIFGCGQGGLSALALAATHGWNVEYIVDSDRKKWGHKLEGYDIKNPETLTSEDFDLVIVASGPGKTEIFTFLKKMGLTYKKDYIYFADKVCYKTEKTVFSNNTFFSNIRYSPWLRVKPAPYTPPVTDQDIRNLSSFSPLNLRLYVDFHFTYLPTILRNFDRLSMAHGVEIRAPFMDWRLVCYCFSLPWQSKLGGGFTKRILREAMRGVMPESIRTRTSKIGFGSPVKQWVSGPLKQKILDTVNSRDFIESEIWKGDKIRSVVEKAYANGDTSRVYAFWNYFQATWLMRQFTDKKR